MAIPIIVCADDYGLTPGISKAIRDLAGAGRISATSAMTVSPYWQAEGAALRTARTARIAVGLHFTLTDLGPLSNLRKLAPDGRFPGIRAVVQRATARALPADEIERELNAQLDRFEAVMGEPPAYIDGHHHVHNLPIVRDAVLAIARRRLGRERAYVRYCDEPLAAILKRRIAIPQAIVISLLGRGFARRGRTAGLAGNTSFRGVRTFAEADAARLFAAALRDPVRDMMIMCHPGTGEPVPDIADEINASRRQEFEFLKSDAWPALLFQAGVALSPAVASATSGALP